MFESSEGWSKLQKRMRPPESQHERSEFLAGLVHEAQVQHELWRMTGFDPAQRPPNSDWRVAYWAEQELRGVEGGSLRLAPAGDAWMRDQPAGTSTGVRPFAA